MKYKLALVQTSQNRLSEVTRFVESLNSQTGIDFCSIQYIFVDQGDHKSALKNINKYIDLVYLTSYKCSLSHARNIALKYVDAVYICFPDDDCWYEEDTLSKVFKKFDSGEYQGITGIGFNEYGVLTSTFPLYSQNLTRTKLCAAISYTLFLKYQQSVKFDENMGVGSPHNIGSGEESDYLLTLMDNYGYKVRYDREIIVHHPAEGDAKFDEKSLLKAYSYARGDGYLIKKHNLPKMVLFRYIIRPIGGIIIFSIKGDIYGVKRSYYRLKGRIEGLLFKCK